MLKEAPMRRRQIFAQREHELLQAKIQEEQLKAKESEMKVPNSNIISESAQPTLKEKAAMFLPNEKDIVKPNGTPYRKGGSKPGKGASNPTEKKNKY